MSQVLCPSCHSLTFSCTCCVVLSVFTCCFSSLCSQYDVEEYRRKKEITVRGSGCPKPVTSFHHAQFPRKHMHSWIHLQHCGQFADIHNQILYRPLFLLLPTRICNGCTDAAKLQGTNSHSGSRFPSGTQWERHGGHCSDGFWEDFIGEMCLPLQMNFTGERCERRLNQSSIFFFFQYLLPAIVHINHQPYLERGDGPIVREEKRRALITE